MESLISAYGAILQALLTIAAVVTFFVSLAIQRKISRCLDVLDDLQSEKWDNLSPESANKIFKTSLELYKKRFDSVIIPLKQKLSILTLYLLSIITSILLLAVVGEILIVDAISLLNFVEFLIIASFTIVVFILVALLLYDVLSPEKGWFFKLEQPKRVCTAEFLNKNLGISSRSIIEKIGLIRIYGVKEQSRYFVEYTNMLLSPKMNYRVILKSENQEHIIEKDEIPKRFSSNFIVNKSEFPPMFKLTNKWQLWFEIRGEFPSSFSSDIPNFKSLIYVFEENLVNLPFGISVKFNLKAVAYRMPEWKLAETTIPEGWYWASEEWPHITKGMPSCCIDSKDQSD